MASVRPAVAADLDALIALEQACFDDPWSRDGLLAELEQRHCRPLVAVDGGRAVGSLLAWQMYEDLQINRVAVLPTLRGAGLGTLLVKASLAQAQQEGAHRCLLEVRADNVAAIAVYRRCGFEVMGRRKGYYGDGTDALLMTCALRALA